MPSHIDTLIEKGRADETDAICERHLAQHTRNPSLADLLAHASKFNDETVDDVALAGFHLEEEEYAILLEAIERLKSAKKRTRYA